MSQKSGKKLRKRIDDEVTVDEKLPSADDNNKLHEESGIENGNGIGGDETNNIHEKSEDTAVNGTNDAISGTDYEPKENIVEEQIVQEVVLPEEDMKDNETQQQKEIVEQEVCKIVVSYDESQDKEKEKPVDKNTKIDVIETKVSTEHELEPLLLETEDVDPELEFDDNSDGDSQKSSPILRCTTRRSQTRNIPTPKTPKTIDTNSDDKTSECSDKPSTLTEPTPEITDTESEMSVFKPVTDVYDNNEKMVIKVTDEDLDSFQNISTKAVVGSDTTRNVDLSSYPDGEFELSPFLIQSKERSVGETLKSLSSRRSIRTTKEYVLQNNHSKNYKSLSSLPKRNVTDRIIGIKRKITVDTPDSTKRFKSESAPHLFSYISSPINNFKNRFAKSEIPSSTPKLTAYKSKHVFDNTNVSKITLNETEDVAEKKWCTVM